MPLLIIHAVIACVTLITPNHVTASIQRILARIAVARANARWLAMVANAQRESSSRRSS
jgi:hypothetical protein